MSEVLISVENVGKKFCRDLKRSLWYGVKDSIGDLFRRQPSGAEVGLRPDEFWANRNIGFELKRSQCLGVIGRNGAGKTTLLKMLNGLIKPDCGRIEMRGRVGALIALGAGFNPILTGRENLFVNAAILGMKKRETAKVLDEIVDFAGIEKFLDAPVRTYSSGMQVRLGFAIASTLRPDILIVDEVLAVGDADFRLKCAKRMRQIVDNGASVILVSHNLTDIRNLADVVLVLEHGVPVALGGAQETVASYVASSQPSCEPGSVSWGQADMPGVENVKVRSVSLRPLADESELAVDTGVRIDVQIVSAGEFNLDVTLGVATDENLELFRVGMQLCEQLDRVEGEILVSAKIPRNLLNSGWYWLSLIVGESQAIRLAYLPNVLRFYVKDVPRGRNYRRAPGVIRPDVPWEARNLAPQER